LREEARREQRAQPPRPLLLVFVPVRRHLRLRLGLVFVWLRGAASLRNRSRDRLVSSRKELLHVLTFKHGLT
jgi:hypothetical protein